MVAASAENTLLADAKVPVAEIRVGYATNIEEAALLKKEAYREQIAKGIYQAILGVYDNYLKEE